MWNAVYSENAHMACFGEKRESGLNKIDYALLAIDERTESAVAYMTCRYLDSTSVYWQFGGVFPPIKDTINSWRVYNDFKEYHQNKEVERIATYIENKNKVMLKMAMKLGFEIVGVKVWEGKVLLEHSMELKK